jgi:hypothetical protein
MANWLDSIQEWLDQNASLRALDRGLDKGDQSFGNANDGLGSLAWNLGTAPLRGGSEALKTIGGGLGMLAGSVKAGYDSLGGDRLGATRTAPMLEDDPERIADPAETIKKWGEGGREMVGGLNALDIASMAGGPVSSALLKGAEGVSTAGRAAKLASAAKNVSRVGAAADVADSVLGANDLYGGVTEGDPTRAIMGGLRFGGGALGAVEGIGSARKAGQVVDDASRVKMADDAIRELGIKVPDEPVVPPAPKSLLADEIAEPVAADMAEDALTKSKPYVEGRLKHIGKLNDGSGRSFNIDIQTSGNMDIDAAAEKMAKAVTNTPWRQQAYAEMADTVRSISTELLDDGAFDRLADAIRHRYKRTATALEYDTSAVPLDIKSQASVMDMRKQIWSDQNFEKFKESLKKRAGNLIGLYHGGTAKGFSFVSKGAARESAGYNGFWLNPKLIADQTTRHANVLLNPESMMTPEMFREATLGYGPKVTDMVERIRTGELELTQQVRRELMIEMFKRNLLYTAIHEDLGHAHFDSRHLAPATPNDAYYTDVGIRGKEGHQFSTVLNPKTIGDPNNVSDMFSVFQNRIFNEMNDPTKLKRLKAIFDSDEMTYKAGQWFDATQPLSPNELMQAKRPVLRKGRKVATREASDAAEEFSPTVSAETLAAARKAEAAVEGELLPASVREASNSLPPPPDGHTRLWRVEGQTAVEAGGAGGVEGGNWFEKNLGAYATEGTLPEHVRYVDVPNERLKMLEADPNSTEFQLPDGYVAQSKQLVGDTVLEGEEVPVVPKKGRAKPKKRTEWKDVSKVETPKQVDPNDIDAINAMLDETVDPAAEFLSTADRDAIRQTKIQKEIGRKTKLGAKFGNQETKAIPTPAATAPLGTPDGGSGGPRGPNRPHGSAPIPEDPMGENLKPLAKRIELAFGEQNRLNAINDQRNKSARKIKMDIAEDFVGKFKRGEINGDALLDAIKKINEGDHGLIADSLGMRLAPGEFDQVMRAIVDADAKNTFVRENNMMAWKKLADGKRLTEGEADSLRQALKTIVPQAVQNAWWNSLIRTGENAIGGARALMSSMDLSAAGRQALFASVTNPKEMARAFKDQIRALMMTKPEFENYMKNLMDKDLNPFAEVAEASGLHITAPHDIGILQEEAFINPTWAEKIPGVRRTEQAYIAYLNKMRIEIFNKGAKALLESGVEPFVEGVISQPFKDLAYMSNTLTGRGEMSLLHMSPSSRMGKVMKLNAEFAPGEKTMNQMHRVLTSVFFAPRFAASRAAILRDSTLMLMGGGNLDPKVYRMYMKNVYGTYAAIGAVAALAVNSGIGTFQMDPRKNDFGNLKVGNVRYDLFGGIKSWAKLYAMLGTDKYWSNTYGWTEYGERLGAKRKRDEIWKFGQGKLSPGAGFLLEALTGEDYLGRKSNAIKAAFGHTIPMILQTAAEVAQADEVDQMAIAVPAAALGVGVNAYKPSRGGSWKR